MDARIIVYLLAFLVFPTVVAASDNTYDTANEPTPIRLLVCGGLGNDCFVSARFKELKSCEFYKEFGGAHCDHNSTPGKIICDTSTKSKTSTAFCTK